jgi:hypothetical protein
VYPENDFNNTDVSNHPEFFEMNSKTTPVQTLRAEHPLLSQGGELNARVV